MKKDNKKALYESIMASVAKEVKKALNESRTRDGYKNISIIISDEQYNDILNAIAAGVVDWDISRNDKYSDYRGKEETEYRGISIIVKEWGGGRLYKFIRNHWNIHDLCVGFFDIDIDEFIETHEDEILDVLNKKYNYHIEEDWRSNR